MNALAPRSQTTAHRTSGTVIDTALIVGALMIVGSVQDTAIGRLAMIRRAIASGAGTCFRRFLAAVDETRRIQTVIEQARYRHLIDSE
jgi:hypothetical protein